MRSVGIKYGGIYGLILVVLSLVSSLMGLDQGAGGMIGILVWIGTWLIGLFIIYLACKVFRDEINGGGLNMGEAIKMALTVSLIASVIAAIYVFINANFIDPGAGERALEAARETWEEANMSDEQIAQSESITKMMLNPAILAPMTVVIYALGGLIKGLICGGILSKEKPPMV